MNLATGIEAFLPRKTHSGNIPRLYQYWPLAFSKFLTELQLENFNNSLKVFSALLLSQLSSLTAERIFLFP
jgi:hypothetical protein